MQPLNLPRQPIFIETKNRCNLNFCDTLQVLTRKPLENWMRLILIHHHWIKTPNIVLCLFVGPLSVRPRSRRGYLSLVVMLGPIIHFWCFSFTDPYHQTYSESLWHVLSPMMTMTKTHAKTKTKRSSMCHIFYMISNTLMADQSVTHCSGCFSLLFIVFSKIFNLLHCFSQFSIVCHNFSPFFIVLSFRLPFHCVSFVSHCFS